MVGERLSFLGSPGAHMALPGTDPIKFAEKHGLKLMPVEEQLCARCEKPKPLDIPFMGRDGVYGVMSSPCKHCGNDSKSPYCLILPSNAFKEKK